MNTFVVVLPWPPSVNRYWRRRGARYFVSQEGQEFRSKTQFLCLKAKGTFKPTDRLAMTIDAFPPDKRRRDLDNIFKGILDSLQHAEVYKDDNQIDELSIFRKSPLLGEVVVTISVIQNGISSSGKLIAS